MRREIGQSDWADLRNIEQHGHAVGHDVNTAETVVVEAVNLNPRQAAPGRAEWGLPRNCLEGETLE